MLAHEEVRSEDNLWELILYHVCSVYQTQVLELDSDVFTLLAPSMYGEAGVGVEDRISCMLVQFYH